MNCDDGVTTGLGVGSWAKLILRWSGMQPIGEVKLALGAAADQYLSLVADRRGQDAADELRREAREQYRRGNRGRAGEWHE